MAARRVIVVGPEDDDFDDEFDEENGGVDKEVEDTGPHLKTSYRIEQTLTSVYTGGKVVVSSSSLQSLQPNFTTNEEEAENDLFALCACTEGVNAVRLRDSKVVAAIKSDAGAITSFALSPNNKQVVTSSSGQQLQVWDLMKVIDIYNGRNTSSDIIPLNNNNASSSSKQSNAITTTSDIEAKNLKAAIRLSLKLPRGHVLDLEYDPTGVLCAAGSSDNVVRVFDVDNGYCTHNFRGHEGIVSKVMFHPDPHRLQLFSISTDCTVRMWDLVSKDSVVFSGHMSVPTCMTFSSSGWELITAGRDRVLNVWDLRQKKLSKTIPVYQIIEGIARVTPNTKSKKGKQDDSTKVVIAGEKGVLEMWDIGTSKMIASQTTIEDYKCSFEILLESGAGFVSVTQDQNILIHDRETLNIKKQIIGHNDEVIDVKFLGKDQTHLAVATNSEQIRVFETKTMSSELLVGHKDIVLCLDVSFDGQHIVSSSKDHTVRVWDAEIRRCIGICEGHTEAVGTVAFAKKSNGFAISGSEDRTVKKWFLTPMFSTSKKNKAQSTDVHKPASAFTIKAHDKDINSIAVAPNDKIFATGSQDRTAKIWSTENGSLLGTLVGHKRGVWCVEFSSFDQCIATTSGDKTIKLWSLGDYSCLKTFEGHSSTVLKVAFLTLGMQLISTSADGLLKLWTIKTNECVNTFDAHEDKIWALAVKKDEEYIVSGSADSVLNVWKDYTRIEEKEQNISQKQKLLQEQELLNCLRSKNYKTAVALALTLEQPARLYKIFEEIIDAPAMNSLSVQPQSQSTTDSIQEIISWLSNNQIEQALKYIRDWNTNAKTSVVAQKLLNYILRRYKPSELRELPAIKEIIEALIAYTDRHFQRLDRLVRQSFLIDYTLRAIAATNAGEQIPLEEPSGLDLVSLDEDEIAAPLPTKALPPSLPKKKKAQQIKETTKPAPDAGARQLTSFEVMSKMMKGESGDDIGSFQGATEEDSEDERLEEALDNFGNGDGGDEGDEGEEDDEAPSFRKGRKRAPSSSSSSSKKTNLPARRKSSFGGDKQSMQKSKRRKSHQ